VSAKNLFRVNKPLFSTLLLLAIIFLFVLILHLPYNPAHSGLSPDSGVFSFGGSEILKGKILYRDFWDNKNPGIFYINALAQKIGGGNPWSIWWFEIAWMTITILVFQRLILKLTGPRTATIMSLILLLSLMYPDYFQGGNFPETFHTLIQIIILGTLVAYLRTKKNRWIILIGLLIGVSFTFKQIFIGMGVATTLTLLLHDFMQDGKRRAFKDLILIASGFSIPLVVIVLVWAINGALNELIYATLVYSLSYAGSGFSLTGIYGTLRTFLITPPLSWLSLLASASMGLFIFRNWKSFLSFARKREPPKNTRSTSSAPEQEHLQRWIFTAIYIAIPIEILLVFSLGRFFGHYFLTPILALAAASAYLIHELHLAIRDQDRRSEWAFGSLILIVVIGFAFFIETGVKEIPGRSDIDTALTQSLSGGYYLSPLNHYIIENSTPSDPILVYEMHGGIYFLTQRQPSTNLITPLHLFASDPDVEERFHRYLSELQADPPKIILAQENSSSGMPYFGVEKNQLCPNCSQASKDGIIAFQDFIYSNYTQAESIGDWAIFNRNSSTQ
jgi:4-amino-4-deoxy-L-arabinose transferase-like glycosyltransferase